MYSEHKMRIIPALVLIVLLTVFLAVGVSSDSEYNIFLPVVSQSSTTVPEVVIYDLDGNVTTWEWLVETFGPVVVSYGNPTVVELRAIEGPATLVVDVGAVGVPVVFYWEDAPMLPMELHNCGWDRGLVVFSKENGRASFAMGAGSYHWPPEPGPHWIWMEGSGCLGKIGMLGGTNHIHLDSVWR